MPESHQDYYIGEQGKHYLEEHLPGFLDSINELLQTKDVTVDTLRQAHSFVEAAERVIVGKLANTKDGIAVKKAINDLKEWVIINTHEITS